jgi:5-formyltetrahydrofolate cyclo-ligase
MGRLSQSPGADLVAAKAELRRRLLAARRGWSAPRRREADAALVAAVLDLVAARAPDIVAGYVPLPNEPGGPTLLPALAAVVPEVIVPVLLPDRDLDWAGYPEDAPCSPAAIGRADLVVVPAVAVDRRGVRLGRGGGSYDRALTRVDPGALVVALLYDGELLDAVPAQPHDRAVDGVVTPTGGVRLFRTR